MEAKSGNLCEHSVQTDKAGFRSLQRFMSRCLYAVAINHKKTVLLLRRPLSYDDDAFCARDRSKSESICELESPVIPTMMSEKNISCAVGQQPKNLFTARMYVVLVPILGLCETTRRSEGMVNFEPPSLSTHRFYVMPHPFFENESARIIGLMDCKD